MPNTTPAPESIDADALLLVSGGCGHRGRRGPIIINNNNCSNCCVPPAGPPTPTLPTAPGTPAPTAPSEPQTIVTTNVSINGQPIAGQGQTAAA